MLVLWERQKLSVSDIGQRLLLEANILTPLITRSEQAAAFPAKIMGSFQDPSIIESGILSFQYTLGKLIGILWRKGKE